MDHSSRIVVVGISVCFGEGGGVDIILLVSHLLLLLLLKTVASDSSHVGIRGNIDIGGGGNIS